MKHVSLLLLGVSFGRASQGDVVFSVFFGMAAITVALFGIALRLETHR